jgi:hypothetical protein
MLGINAEVGTECDLLGPNKDMCQAIPGRGPLAVTIAIPE